MTQEERQLLLTDLCARLPYGIMVKVNDTQGIIDGIDISNERIFVSSINPLLYGGAKANWFTVDGDKIYPYLRSMSSMTEEEKKKLQEIIKSNPISPFGKLTNKCDNLTRSVAYGTFDVLSYLLSRHFDVHCLIENGLALEAPEGMYNLKEK